MGCFQRKVRLGKNAKWINCDTCDRKMHVECIGRKHAGKFNLNVVDSSDSENECDFVCEVCYTFN